MAFVHTVSPDAKKFTQQDLDLTNLYVNTEVYPGLYSSEELPKGFKFVKREIIDIDTIESDVDSQFTGLDTKGLGNNFFVTQGAFVRSDGRGANADDVDASIAKMGYQLNHIPISVAICPNGKTMIVDGRTRLARLRSLGFTNVIVDVYECDNWNAYSIEALKRNPPESSRSPMKKEDLIANCNYAVKNGWIKANYDEIRDRLEFITGNRIHYNTMQKIIHSVQQGQNNTSAVLSLSDATANEWMRTYGYVDNEKNNGIYYKVVAASAWSKSISAVAKRLNELEETGKRVKELRIVLHTGTLDAADTTASWKNKIDSYRNGWREDMSNIERAYFSEYTKRATVKLFGAIPACGELKDEYPMDKLVMFHVGKLKDRTFLDLSVEESLEENILF